MKKKNLISKVLVLALALVMVFTMTASAFASTASVNVAIKMYGENYITANVSAADIAARANGAAHLYSMEGASEDVPNVGYTVADALIEAWYDYYEEYGVTSYEGIITYGWDNNPVEGDPGMYFDMFDGMSSDAGSYYFVGMTSDGLYKYYWRGDSWTLYIDGSSTPADEYSTSHGISTTSSVVFDYNSVRSEDFTLDYYIDDCPNASEDPYN